MNNRSGRTNLNDYSDKNVRNVNFSAARELTEHACLLYHLVRLTAGGGFRFIQNRDTFDRVNDQPISRPKLVANDNDTSACFEKLYSPQIQACGGLLTYSPPAVSYRISEN